MLSSCTVQSKPWAAVWHLCLARRVHLAGYLMPEDQQIEGEEDEDEDDEEMDEEYTPEMAQELMRRGLIMSKHCLHSKLFQAR